MPNETIVAVFETSARADEAMRALEAAGVSSRAIERHTKQSERSTARDSPAPTAAAPSTGFFFWDMMLGSQSSHQDRPSYERSMERGETVVAVTIAEREAETVIAVLEDHSPLSLDEQAEEDEASEEDDSAETSERARAGTRVESERISRTPSRATGDREEVIPLAEEELQVGKRTVSRGTTRVRRYVVESPVEQTVSLREERVVLEKRRPATDEVTGDAFTDKTVEVTETSEVPVTEKVARLKEEVVVRRQGTERTEKVRDTVRRDQIEVEDADETPAARRRSNA